MWRESSDGRPHTRVQGHRPDQRHDQRPSRFANETGPRGERRAVHGRNTARAHAARRHAPCHPPRAQ
eukprot:1342103-Prymnesium_polylepis.1